MRHRISIAWQGPRRRILGGGVIFLALLLWWLVPDQPPTPHKPTPPSQAPPSIQPQGSLVADHDRLDPPPTQAPSVRVVVHNASGAPIAHCAVRLLAPHSRSYRVDHPVEASTASDGQAVLPAPQQEARLVVTHPDHAPAAVDIGLPPQPTYLVVLDPACRLEVAIRDTTGQPVRGVLLTLSRAILPRHAGASEAPAWAGNQPAGQQPDALASEFTDDDGRARFASLPRSRFTYSLHPTHLAVVHGPSGFIDLRASGDSRSVELVVAPAAAVILRGALWSRIAWPAGYSEDSPSSVQSTVQVTRAALARQHPGCRIHVAVPTRSILPSDRAEVELFSARGAGIRHAALIASADVATPQATPDIDPAHPPGSLCIRLSSADLVPLPRALVHARPAEGGTDVSLTLRSDDVVDLPPGTYDLRLPEWGMIGTATVEPGARADTHVILPSVARPVRVDVRLPDGSEPQATVLHLGNGLTVFQGGIIEKVMSEGRHTLMISSYGAAPVEVEIAIDRGDRNPIAAGVELEWSAK